MTRKKEVIREIEAALKGEALDLARLSLATLLSARDDIVLGLNRK